MIPENGTGSRVRENNYVWDCWSGRRQIGQRHPRKDNNGAASDLEEGSKLCSEAVTTERVARRFADPKSRGIPNETLVLWAASSGAPTSDGAKGRDHEHTGLSVWMAAGCMARATEWPTSSGCP